MTGRTYGTIASSISRKYKGWVRVNIEPEKFPDNDGGLWWYDEDGSVARED